MNLRTSPIVFLFLVLLLLSKTVAQAHSGEPRLEISPERLSPGAALDVRGVNYEPEEVIILTLVGPRVELPLGEVMADPEGIFIQVVVLPENLVEGIYMLRANTDDHVNFSPQFTVIGDAPSSPSNDQAGSTPAVASELVSRTTTPSESVSPLTQTVVLAIVFLVLIAVVILGRMAMGNR